jgi:hypothetical protein
MSAAVAIRYGSFGSPVPPLYFCAQTLPDNPAKAIYIVYLFSFYVKQKLDSHVRAGDIIENLCAQNYP